MKIAANKSVSAEYELYVDGEENEELELMEKATLEEPLNFIFGVGMMLPKFEENLFGMEKGDKFDFVINTEDAYGLYDDESVIDTLTLALFQQYVAEGIIQGGMIPKLENSFEALNAGVKQVIITRADQIHTQKGTKITI